MGVELPAHERVVRPDEIERRRVAKPHGHLGRPDDVGEHHGAKSGIDGRRRRAACGRRKRIADASEERLDRGEVDRDDGAGDPTMRVPMDALGRGGVRGMDEAEAGAALFVEPVGDVLDALAVLDFQVAAAGLGDVLMRQPAHVVAIHEDRHARRSASMPRRRLRPPGGCSGSLGRGSRDRMSFSPPQGD